MPATQLLKTLSDCVEEARWLRDDLNQMDAKVVAIVEAVTDIPVTVADALKNFLATKDDELHEASKAAAYAAVDDQIKRGNSIFDLTTEAVADHAYKRFQRNAMSDPELIRQIIDEASKAGGRLQLALEGEASSSGCASGPASNALPAPPEVRALPAPPGFEAMAQESAVNQMPRSSWLLPASPEQPEGSEEYEEEVTEVRRQRQLADDVARLDAWRAARSGK